MTFGVERRQLLPVIIGFLLCGIAMPAFAEDRLYSFGAVQPVVVLLGSITFERHLGSESTSAGTVDTTSTTSRQLQVALKLIW